MKGLLVFELHKGNTEPKNYVLTGLGTCSVFESNKDTPELVLAYKAGCEYRYCFPKADEGKPYICATGDYITSCDSRFPSKYPIPIHRSQPHLFS